MRAPSVSVVVVTKNEAARIEACLAALQNFDDIWVVDSESKDATQVLAEKAGARVVNFQWNGQYPKKRQWCLDTLDLKYDFVFFIDADEIATPALIDEMRGLDFKAAGYFVKGRYVFDGKPLKFGLKNNKLCLIDRTRMEFPVVDDLDLGLGEMEGHYQPILKNSSQQKKIGQLKNIILHNAFEGGEAWRSSDGDGVSGWEARHKKYAAWERGMNARGAWPEDKRLAKRLFKALPFQSLIAFAHSYVLKLGFLDGVAGFKFAKTRWRYYRMIGA